MSTLSTQFAQAIVDHSESLSETYSRYCTFCGIRHKSVLRATGFFMDEPQHTKDCVVVLAQNYLGLDRPYN